MRRILRSKDKKEVVDTLADGKDTIFGQIWKLLLFAAMLGCKDGNREPLTDGDRNTGIDPSVFGNDPVWPGILYLLALEETKDAHVFMSDEKREDELIERFEEFANRGLSIIKEKLEPHSYSLDAINELIAMECSQFDAPVNRVQEISI